MKKYESPINWTAIKNEYISSEKSYREIAAEYAITLKAVSYHAKKENWQEAREQFRNKTTTAVIKRNLDKNIAATEKRLDDINAIADQAIQAAAEALNNIKLQPVKRTTKKKIYDKSTGKVKEEIINESIELVDAGIDAFQLNQLTIALKNLKEIKNIQSELSRREQEARIAKLEKDANINDGDTDVINLIDIAETMEQPDEQPNE